jgi:iron complex outermembrane receptor protein
VNFEADAGLRPFTSQNGYRLFNLRLGLAEIDDRWSIEGWVNNVGNKHYITTEFALPVAVLQTWAIPRTFGGTAKLNF